MTKILKINCRNLWFECFIL